MQLRLLSSLLFSCAAAVALPSCSSDGADAGITGVYDAELQLQAGNTEKLRYWFSSDGKWGRAHQQTVGVALAVTCGTTAETAYELKGDKVYLRHGATTQERTWTLLEGSTILKLDPPDKFLNGTPANSFKRVTNAQTNRTCNTAFD